MRSSLAVLFTGLGAFAALVAVAQTNRPRATPPTVVLEPTVLYETPPGVSLHDWVPLGPSSGIALQATGEAVGEGELLGGVVWAKVRGHWHPVSLPVPHSGSTGVVPAVR